MNTQELRSPLWYWLRAAYVSRREYAKAVAGFAVVCGGLWLAGWFWQLAGLQVAGYAIAGFGLANFLFTLVGLYFMYGHVSRRYYRRLLEAAQLPDDARIADVHVGTYRATWNFADLLPRSRIASIDIWDDRYHGEKALYDVRRLEAPTLQAHERIDFLKGDAERLPLPHASVDAVTLGFGIHEIPGGKRDALFGEIRRILKPGGKLAMYERGWNLPNYFVFGPGMFHFTRTGDWIKLLKRHFDNVHTEKAVGFVDLFLCSNTGATAFGPHGLRPVGVGGTP